MRVALLSPMPPARTGIAHYSAMLAPALAEHVELTVVDSPSSVNRQPSTIYQLGNNPHHEWIYREAMRTPGVIVLHDVVLHHLIVEMTLARGDAESYVAALVASHGEAGAAWARGRAAGLHGEMGNFLLPGSIDLARRSRAVIVHNRWAADVLRSFGVATPIHVVPHPSLRRRPSSRSPGGKRVIGVFGFLTSAKRGEVILEAFARAADPALDLLIVGEPAPNIDLASFQRPGITITGFVSDDEFDAWYDRVDRLVNLRYPSAGETSGTLIRAFEAGKPVAVSDYAQFAEYPDDCAVKIPLGAGEVDALVDFFRRDLDEERIVAAQRAWLDTNARMDQTVAGYLQALESPTSPSSFIVHPSPLISLFPSLEVVARRGNLITVRNTGDGVLQTRVYGSPAYRMIAKLFDGEREIDDRWIELPRDVAPGETADVEVPYRAGATLRLYHALQSVPMLQPEAWYAAAL